MESNPVCGYSKKLKGVENTTIYQRMNGTNSEHRFSAKLENQIVVE
jgi:hypothetical protein